VNRRLSDRGVTLVEMMVTVSLLSVAMTGVFSVFTSLTRADQRNSQAVETRQEVLQALGEVSRDVRGARRIVTPPTSSSAGRSLQLEVTGQDASPGFVSFSMVDTTLIRSSLKGENGGSMADRIISDSIDADADVGFRYFAADGRELVAGVEKAGTIAACSTRIRVTVAVKVRPDAVGRSISVDAALRGVRPEEVPC